MAGSLNPFASFAALRFNLLVAGRWSLVAGRWSLVAGRMPSPRGALCASIQALPGASRAGCSFTRTRKPNSCTIDPVPAPRVPLS
ncbi:hypothetical protein EBL85_05610 [Marichromatium sp. AB32]|nr:hypothetical protein EBL85_05610 [Marichromatium sp. AB32]